MNDELLRNQLIADIERLKAEKERIKEEIDKIEQKDERLRARHRVGTAKECLYWRLPVKYLESIFFTRKEELAKENEVCLLEKEFGSIISNSFDRYDNTFHMAILCEDTIDTGNGYRLAVRDPYKRVLTNPLEMSPETAYGLKGKIIYVDFKKSSEGDAYIYVKRWKETSLTLLGYKEEKDAVRDEIAKVLLEFKHVSNEEEAISSVTMMQNYFRMQGKEYKVLRMSPSEIRILRDQKDAEAILYGIKFEQDSFWFLKEEGHVFQAETLIGLEKDFPNLHYPGEYAARSRWAFKNLKETGEDIPVMENI